MINIGPNITWLLRLAFLNVFIIFSSAMYAQRSETVSNAYHIKIEDKQLLLEKLKAENLKNGQAWQSELDARKRNLPSEQTVSDNIMVTVKPTVDIKLTEEGGEELNLNVNFTYETAMMSTVGNKKKNVASNAYDDFPSGAYNPSLSNACMLTCDYMKSKIETELAPYLIEGRKVTIKITGETDGSQIRSAIPYRGEFGDFRDRPIFLNGKYSSITVTSRTGVTTNVQLAFLRTQGVEQFLKNAVPEMQKTDNQYVIYAVENSRKGNQYRRISIDITIHGAFDQKVGLLTNASGDVPSEEIDSGVDADIPSSSSESSNTFALIFANENYNELVPKVPFASNDGKTFKEYCIRTIGVPEKQVKYIEDATLNGFNEGVDWLRGVAESWNGESRIIVYYAGHGVPDPETSYSFLVPTDANPEKKNQLYSLGTLYQTLGSLPAKSVMIFIDACFSGTKRNGEMLVQDTRGVKISVKEDVLEGNMVVFSAASGNQTAYPQREQKHGLFTYYLLKTLKDSRGNISYGDLFQKVKTGVSREASVASKQQIPSVNVSLALLGSWESLTVKE